MDETRRVVTHVVEDYVKAIYKLQQESESVSTTDLSRRMGTSAAASSKMMKYLASHQIIDHTPYHGVRLTDLGRRIALETIRHHRLLELYLCKALGYSWDQVDAEAEKLEHHISEEFEERIDRMLGHPEVDPHGAPIPTRDGHMPPKRGIPLSEADIGSKFLICRVSDRSSEALRYLAEIGLTLDTAIEVVERKPFGGPLTLRIDGHDHAVSPELASRVYVEPLPAG